MKRHHQPYRIVVHSIAIKVKTSSAWVSEKRREERNRKTCWIHTTHDRQHFWSNTWNRVRPISRIIPIEFRIQNSRIIRIWTQFTCRLATELWPHDANVFVTIYTLLSATQFWLEWIAQHHILLFSAVYTHCPPLDVIRTATFIETQITHRVCWTLDTAKYWIHFCIHLLRIRIRFHFQFHFLQAERTTRDNSCYPSLRFRVVDLWCLSFVEFNLAFSHGWMHFLHIFDTLLFRFHEHMTTHRHIRIYLFRFNHWHLHKSQRNLTAFISI